MKDISEVYKEWCGSDVHTNDCHPVHDSSEAIEFAEEWAAEIVKNLPNESETKKVCDYGFESNKLCNFECTLTGCQLI